MEMIVAAGTLDQWDKRVREMDLTTQHTDGHAR